MNFIDPDMDRIPFSRANLKRQFAFDRLAPAMGTWNVRSFGGGALQEVPTGADDSGSLDDEVDNSTHVPLLTPVSKDVVSRALDASFSDFGHERDRLGIPADPQEWTEAQVSEWLTWALREFSLPPLSSPLSLSLSGGSLCHLSKELFLDLAPDFSGDILWEHLQFLLRESKNFKSYLSDSAYSSFSDSEYQSDRCQEVPSSSDLEPADFYQEKPFPKAEAGSLGWDLALDLGWDATDGGILGEAGSLGEAGAGSLDQAEAGGLGWDTTRSLGKAGAGSLDQAEAGGLGWDTTRSLGKAGAGSLDQAEAGGLGWDTTRSLGKAEAGSLDQAEAGGLGWDTTRSLGKAEAGSLDQAEAGGLGWDTNRSLGKAGSLGWDTAGSLDKAGSLGKAEAGGLGWDTARSLGKAGGLGWDTTRSLDKAGVVAFPEDVELGEEEEVEEVVEEVEEVPETGRLAGRGPRRIKEEVVGDGRMSTGRRGEGEWRAHACVCVCSDTRVCVCV
ncbi:uncharacterized protein LOC142923953 isoform X3 [Petromyzon marinus]|uniref:uncharacterized protein LOC142923953 isoform X3 n=1 Tax=Petromyzon marinus TaxID=7757 RepID=UPI003F719F2F